MVHTDPPDDKAARPPQAGGNARKQGRYTQAEGKESEGTIGEVPAIRRERVTGTVSEAA